MTVDFNSYGVGGGSSASSSSCIDIKNIETVVLSLPMSMSVEISSKEEASHSQAEEDCSVMPGLMKDDDDEEARDQIMRSIVILISSSLSTRCPGHTEFKGSSSCCQPQAIQSILMNLLNCTKFDLDTFINVVLNVNHHINIAAAGARANCVKYIILGCFINQDAAAKGQVQGQGHNSSFIQNWSSCLKMSSNTIIKLTQSYHRVNVSAEDHTLFKNNLKLVLLNNNSISTSTEYHGYQYISDPTSHRQKASSVY